MRRLFASLAVVPGALAAAACVIVDPGCSPGSASVYVSPTVVVVAVGQSVTPEATASWCADGHRQHASPRWVLVQPGDSAFVSLDHTTGTITGRRAGGAVVAAESERTGDRTTIAVTVR